MSELILLDNFDQSIKLVFVMNNNDWLSIIVLGKVLLNFFKKILLWAARNNMTFNYWVHTISNFILTAELQYLEWCITVMNKSLNWNATCSWECNHFLILELPNTIDGLVEDLVWLTANNAIVLINDQDVIISSILVKLIDGKYSDVEVNNYKFVCSLKSKLLIRFSDCDFFTQWTEIFGNQSLDPSFTRASRYSCYNEMFVLRSNCSCNHWLILTMTVDFNFIAECFRNFVHGIYTDWIIERFSMSLVNLNQFFLR